MRKILFGMLICNILTPAYAADKGAYAGISLGYANTGAISGRSLTSSSNMIYGFLGGYQFNKNFSVEVQQLDTGKFSYSPDVSGKSDAWSISGLGMLPVSRNSTLYGRLGVAATQTELSANALPSTGARRTAPTYGAGVQYKILPGVAARLEWNRYTATIKNNDNIHQDYNSSVWTLGAIAKF
ncbi:MAG: outer membrane beta-barrel protein [Pseudomonadota bacterium]